jgi:hypothetical protein
MTQSSVQPKVCHDVSAVYGQLGDLEHARVALRELHAPVSDFEARAREEYGKRQYRTIEQRASYRFQDQSGRNADSSALRFRKPL